MVTELEYGSSQEAWAGLNEHFLLKEDDIVENGGTRYGALLVAYDYMVTIRTLWVDPEFDYGNMFNYRRQKWVSLVNNYVDLNYLDLVKAEVLRREASNSNSYNISFIFDNSHGSGKGCLLNLTFTRRPTLPNPLVIVTLRSSEIVKRLNFDFLLIQRMAEYVYGDKRVSAKIFFPNIYSSAETSAMYHKYHSLEEVFAKPLRRGFKPFQERVWGSYKKYSSVDPETISFKVHRRVAKALQGKDIPQLKAKDLKLIN